MRLGNISIKYILLLQILRKGTAAEFEKLDALNAFKGFPNLIRLQRDQFLMPGLVDCHTHGPQFPNLGLGLDRPLLEWLEKYTFPLETQFAVTEYASRVYSEVVVSTFLLAYTYEIITKTVKMGS